MNLKKSQRAKRIAEKWIHKLGLHFEHHESRWRIFYKSLAAAALLLQFAFLASLNWQRAESRAVLRFQNPASEVNVSQVFQWNAALPVEGYYQNPLYTKLSWLLSKFAVGPHPSDVQIHFLMQVLNLVILFMLALLISVHFVAAWEDRLLSTLVLVGIFAGSSIAASLVFSSEGALLSYLVMVLGFFAVASRSSLFLKSEVNKSGAGSKAASYFGIFSGLALAASFSSLGLLPAFFFLYFAQLESNSEFRIGLDSRGPQKTPWRSSIFLVFMCAIVTFVLLSLPQTSDLSSFENFLIHSFKSFSFFDADYLSASALGLAKLLFWLVLWRLFSLICLSSTPRELSPLDWPEKGRLIFAGLILAPVIIFASGAKVLTMILPAAIFLFFSVLDSPLNQWLERWSFYKKIQSLRMKPWRFIAAYVSLPFFFSVFPESYFQTLQAEVQCRGTVQQLQRIIEEKTLQGRSVLADADLPYEVDVFGKKWVHNLSEMNFNTWYSSHPDVIIFSKKPSHFFSAKPRDVWKVFEGKNEVLDPLGYQWLLEKDDPCGFQIWEKQ